MRFPRGVPCPSVRTSRRNKDMEKAPHEQGFLVYQIYADLHKTGFYDTEPALFFSSIPLPFRQKPQSLGIKAAQNKSAEFSCNAISGSRRGARSACPGNKQAIRRALSNGGPCKSSCKCSNLIWTQTPPPAPPLEGRGVRAELLQMLKLDLDICKTSCKRSKLIWTFAKPLANAQT